MRDRHDVGIDEEGVKGNMSVMMMRGRNVVLSGCEVDVMNSAEW